MEPTSEPLKWYYKPLTVIFLLVLVVGPLGLPLVYKSPKFSRAAKIAVTLLMIPYTWWIVVFTQKTLEETSRTLSELQEVIR